MHRATFFCSSLQNVRASRHPRTPGEHIRSSQLSRSSNHPRNEATLAHHPLGSLSLPHLRRCRLSIARSTSQAEVEAADDAQERRFVQAVLICFYASQNRSLFSAKCFVETLIALYRNGYSLDELKLAVTFATLTTSDPMKPMMQDVLLAWSAVILITLRAVGVPLLPRGEERVARRARSGGDAVAAAEESNRMHEGLQAFVLSCIEQYMNGLDLYRLQLQQSMTRDVQDPEIEGASPTVAILQQNTRLAIITLEVIRDLGLPTTTKLARQGEPEAPSSFGAPVGFVSGYLPDALVPKPDLEGPERASAVREAAVRLLIAFNGAVLGYLRSARAFVSDAYACYTAGWAAEEIFSALNDEEFAQSGGVFRIEVANIPGGRHVSATLFARWLSVVFMTLAQLGVSHPGATQYVGWAWVRDAGSDGGGLEAHGVADFVASTLRLAVLSDEESGGDEEARAEGGRRGARVVGGEVEEEITEKSGLLEGFVAGAIEDPKLGQTSSFALILSQEISLVRLTRIFVLETARMEA